VNLTSQLEQYLPRQLLELVKNTNWKAERIGQKVYIVGGAVRDLFLGFPNFDLDLVTEGNAISLAQQVAETSRVRFITYPQFGTAKLKFSNYTLDIATARNETYIKPGALPTVSPGTIDEDLFRRDFSINAMAISLASRDYGELLDPYHGKDDLEQRLIRVLHPKSFTDDATRILRAIRYEQRLGFRLELQTAQLLKHDTSMLDTISGDRIRHELKLVLEERYPELVVKRLSDLGVLEKIAPSLKGNGWIAGKFHKAREISSPGQLPSLYLCLLAYPLNEQEVEQFICYLHIPAKLAQTLRHTIRLKPQLHLLGKAPMKNSDIYNLLRDYSILAIQTNAIATDSAVAYSHIQSFLTKLRYIKPCLAGEDLIKLGISTGPLVGKILEMLHKAKLDGEISTREEEERLVLSLRP
jgi:tRNA nucleotidyltransferase (CCA-adding enzyme)